ncbi:MAG: alpha/beta hydrolase [Candidatus Flexifilum sp.]
MTDDLLERLARAGNPLIDGDRATFVWVGDVPPLLIGDFTGWHQGVELTRVPDADGGQAIWAHTVTLPRAAYVEYAWARQLKTDTTPEVRIPDPYNARTIWNGIDADNHWFGMPEYQPTGLIRRRRGIARGRITRIAVAHDLMIARKPRSIWLYQPPVQEPVPLLVVWDGRDYLTRARLPAIVDNLIGLGRIRPIALALIDNAGKLRFQEYLMSEGTIALLTEVLLPTFKRHLNLIDPEVEPRSWGVLGASMGGLMALFTGLRLPHIFGHVISQSGAFEFRFGERRPLMDEIIRKGKRRKLTIWQDVGSLEWLYPANQRMNRLLRKRGYRVSYRVFEGGHNYTCWRNQLPDALSAVYGQGE